MKIRIARRVAWRELAERLALMEHNPDFAGDYNSVVADCQFELEIGLRHCAKLNVLKIMDDALCHPLFQNKRRMVASSLCTEKQYDSGKKELIRRIAHFDEGQTASDEAISTVGARTCRPMSGRQKIVMMVEYVSLLPWS
jgi:hypothetical protein